MILLIGRKVRSAGGSVIGRNTWAKIRSQDRLVTAPYNLALDLRATNPYFIIKKLENLLTDQNNLLAKNIIAKIMYPISTDFCFPFLSSPPSGPKAKQKIWESGGEWKAPKHRRLIFLCSSLSEIFFFLRCVAPAVRPKLEQIFFIRKVKDCKNNDTYPDTKFAPHIRRPAREGPVPQKA